MAAITWFMTNNLASVHQEMSETDPGTENYASPVTGWITGTTVAARYASLDAQTEVANASFTTTVQPDGTINTGAAAGDCLRSLNTYNGSFAAANWVVNLCIRANTGAGGTSRGRVRLFRSVNADGSGATEITAGAQICSTVTPSTSATTNSTITFNPGAFSVANEYIFIQVAWETVTAGSMTTNDVNLRIGNASGAGTRVVSSNFTANAVLSAGANTITLSNGATAVPGDPVPAAGANTITLTAPNATTVPVVTLAAGANTITITAPDATGVFGAGGTDLAAGANTITLSAPTAAVDSPVTVPAGANTITLTAPAQSQLVEVTLAAGANTITLSAPTATVVPGNTTPLAGSNVITLSAPTAVVDAPVTVGAGANVITLSAPSPTIHLTMPAGANTILITAPVAEVLVGGALAAGGNTITVSAPDATMHLTIPAGTNQVTLTAPNVVLDTPVIIAAGEVTITLTAPTATLVQAGNTNLAAGAVTITITAPAATLLFIETTLHDAGFKLVHTDDGWFTFIKDNNAEFTQELDSEAAFKLLQDANSVVTIT